VEPGLDDLGGAGIGEAEGRGWDGQAGRGEGAQARSGEVGGSTKAGVWEWRAKDAGGREGVRLR